MRRAAVENLPVDRRQSAPLATPERVVADLHLLSHTRVGAASLAEPLAGDGELETTTRPAAFARRTFDRVVVVDGREPARALTRRAHHFAPFVAGRAWGSLRQNERHGAHA